MPITVLPARDVHGLARPSTYQRLEPSDVTDMLVSPLTFVARWVGCPKGRFLLTFHALRMDLRADDAAHGLPTEQRDAVAPMGRVE
jgi:hypothetical protein